MQWRVPKGVNAEVEKDETPSEKAAREADEEPEPYDGPRMMSYEEVKRMYPNSLPSLSTLPVTPQSVLPVNPPGLARKAVDEERIRIESNGGTQIPRSDPDFGIHTQQDYSIWRQHVEAEKLKLAEQSGVSLQKPANACRNCRPGHRDANGTCTGWCCSPYTWGNT